MLVTNEAEARVASTGTRATARISSKCTNGLSREAYLAIVVEATRATQ